MANIKVSSITKKEPPCPGPAPKKPKKLQPAPTDAPGAFPPPPPFFMPGPCCPSTTQVVDNITVVSTTPETIEVQEGTCQGMKAYGVGAKTFAGVGTSGMVPVPQPGDENKVLAGDGTWAEIIIQQADWEQDDETQPDYIKNKPDIEEMIDTAVSAERTRATTAENLLQTEITAETTRAKAGEAAATTEVRAGQNASVDETTAPDGHHIYTVNADGKPQVQADWGQEDDTQPDFIKNKPDIEAMIAVETERAETAEIAATTEVRAGENATVDEEVAADGHHIYTVNADGKPQVQADWDQDDDTAVDFIKNKPGVFAGATAHDAGSMGFVPAPDAGSQEMFLRGDGSWANVDNTRECTALEMDAWIDEVENG